jgi:hypothetical protein
MGFDFVVVGAATRERRSSAHNHAPAGCRAHFARVDHERRVGPPVTYWPAQIHLMTVVGRLQCRPALVVPRLPVRASAEQDPDHALEPALRVVMGREVVHAPRCKFP